MQICSHIHALPAAQLDSSLVYGISFHPASVLGPFEAKEALVFDEGFTFFLISLQLPEKLLHFDVSLLHFLPAAIHLRRVFFFFFFSVSLPKKRSGQMELV